MALLHSAPVARAHTTGVSQSEFVMLADGRVEGQLVFAAAELAPAVTIDRDRDGMITDDEVSSARPELERVASDGVQVTADDAVCPSKVRGVELTDGDGLLVRMAFACTLGARDVRATLFILSELRPGHRHAARITADDVIANKVLTGASREIALELPSRSKRGSHALPSGWRRTALVVVTIAWLAFMIGLFVWRWRKAPRRAQRSSRSRDSHDSHDSSDSRER